MKKLINQAAVVIFAVAFVACSDGGAGVDEEPPNDDMGPDPSEETGGEAGDDAGGEESGE